MHLASINSYSTSSHRTIVRALVLLACCASACAEADAPDTHAVQASALQTGTSCQSDMDGGIGVSTGRESIDASAGDADGGIAQIPKAVVRSARSTPDCNIAVSTDEQGELVVDIENLDVQVQEAGTVDTGSCRLDLSVEGPPGYEYALDSVKVEGDADLSASVRSQLSLATGFVGVPRLDSMQYHLLTGPFRDAVNYEATVLETDARHFSACGGRQNVVLLLNVFMDGGDRSGTVFGKQSVTRLKNFKVGVRQCGR